MKKILQKEMKKFKFGTKEKGGKFSFKISISSSICKVQTIFWTLLLRTCLNFIKQIFICIKVIYSIFFWNWTFHKIKKKFLTFFVCEYYLYENVRVEKFLSLSLVFENNKKFAIKLILSCCIALACKLLHIFLPSLIVQTKFIMQKIVPSWQMNKTNWGPDPWQIITTCRFRTPFLWSQDKENFFLPPLNVWPHC